MVLGNPTRIQRVEEIRRQIFFLKLKPFKSERDKWELERLESELIRLNSIMD